ncbi:MAG: BLUF domain-containing protein [Rhodospirillales bacterium]|nr:BLUF domain-containing protein [Acetobacter sp.]
MATRDFAESDLDGMVERSRERNAQRGITCVLLYQGGAFLQAIEGERSAVRTLYKVIEADERHDHVQLLVQTRAARRRFAGQAMGFHRLTDQDCELNRVGSNGLNLSVDHAQHPWKTWIALRLLARFQSRERH